MKKRKIVSLWVTAAVIMSGLSVPGWNHTDAVISNAAEAASDDEPAYSLVIDKENEGIEISQELFGLFFEDINSAADGGLYPEMVKNNSFENYVNDRYTYNVGNETNWKYHWVKSGTGTFTVLRDESAIYALNDKNPNYAVLTGEVILANGGFAQKSSPNAAAMPMKKGNTFDFSMYVKADSTYSGRVYVQVVDANGTALTEEKEVLLEKTGSWVKASTELTSNATEKGKLVLKTEGAGTGEELNLDMVSLLPRDTYGYGDKNYAYGAGIRADLVEKLRDLNPSFMRFPGGCIIEGDGGWESYYNWEESIGPVEERKSIANRWQTSLSSNYSYMQSRGFGYHEMLMLCEDFEMEAFPILSAGVLCQYEAGSKPAAAGEDLEKFAKHATNLIDYCWGNVNSSNAVQSEWAVKRTENGHAQPFNLNYIGIGNENWYAKYLNNFDYIKNYIDDYVAENYPGRSITVISSTGPDSDSTDKYQYAWDWFNEKYAGELLVDEHYYQNAAFMLNNTDRYDYYTRLDNGGSDVFVGEYATHLTSKSNNLESAISDAAYMTGFERNGDIVRHSSYAPLFNKIGASDWTPDLIWFDEYDSFGTPNYYVQQMFAGNYGKKVVNTTLLAKGENYTQNTGSPFLATYATLGEVDSIKVVRSDGTVLLDEDFSDTEKAKELWDTFPGSTGTFEISDGKLTLSSVNGINGVWLPDAVEDPEWYDYTVTAVVRKLSGSEGFIVGVGAKDGANHYMYNMGGYGNTKTIMQRGRSALGTMDIGNEFTYGSKAIPTGEELTVTVNYGAGGKLEAGYVTAADKSKEKDFSSNLKPYQTDIYETVSVDEDYIYVKLVNNESIDKPISLITSNYALDTSKKAEIICLTGERSAVNTMGNEVVVPVSSELEITNNTVAYDIPQNSVNVVKIPLAKVPKEVTVTYKAGTGGRIDGQAAQKIVSGGSTSTVTAVADTGYKFVKWSDGKTNAARKDTNVTGNITYTAQFEKEITLSQVTGVKASGQKTTSIKVSWKKAANAEGYEVYGYNSVTKKWSSLATTKTLSYTNTNLKAGTLYSYKVKAYVKSNSTTIYGAESSVVKTATCPAKPKLNIKKQSGTRVRLSWNKVKGATGYEIQMKTGSGKYKSIKKIGKGSIVKYSKKLKIKKNYAFRVRAIVKVGKSSIYGAYSGVKKVKM